MTEPRKAELPPVSGKWIGFYAFAAFWLLILATQDASHFGPGFFPLLISFVLVPVFAGIFFFDVIARIADAVQGKDAPLTRRLWPLAASLAGAVSYVGLIVYAAVGLSQG